MSTIPATEATVKERARHLVERLRDDATWEDLLYGIEIVRGIERGIAQLDAGLGVPHEEVLRRFGITR